MEERNPLVIAAVGLFKVIKCVLLVFAWCIILLCVFTKNK